VATISQQLLHPKRQDTGVLHTDSCSAAVTSAQIPCGVDDQAGQFHCTDHSGRNNSLDMTTAHAMRNALDTRHARQAIWQN
jgi:hypothetical protein